MQQTPITWFGIYQQSIDKQLQNINDIVNNTQSFNSNSSQSFSDKTMIINWF